MEKMRVSHIEIKTVQGFTLIDVHWESVKGRILAISRAQDFRQYKAGSVYSGRLQYDDLNRRVFSPMAAIAEAA